MEYIKRKINLENYVIRSIPKSVIVTNDKGKETIDVSNSKYFYGTIPDYKVDSEGEFIKTQFGQKIINTIDINIFITQEFDDIGLFTDIKFLPKLPYLINKPTRIRINTNTIQEMSKNPVSNRWTKLI